jgi:hypothetical protein
MISNKLKNIATRYAEFSLSTNTKLKKDISLHARTETIQLKRIKNETKLLNDVIVFENDKEVAAKLYQVVSEFNV